MSLPENLRQAKPASPATRAAQTEVRASLPFENRQSFEDAARGFIATIDPLTIPHARGGRNAYDLSRVGFLNDDAPDTVNPSLWRQAQLNAQHHGLYEVTDGIYQIRSFDLANMTLIRGERGWVIIDPLTSTESAKAGLDLANRQLGERPVTGCIYTHSHVDHFAGVLGVLNPEDAASGRIPVVAPAGFTEESMSENVLAGNVMNRRATYMYGNLLEPSPTGFVTTGLGAALSMGTTGFVPPNDIVSTTGETRSIDGVEFDFQMASGTEAPSEFVFYLPQYKALCMSEITSHHLHNVYTPRGAQVRDALAWSAQINESIERYGEKLEVQFASHHWPIWGREAAVEYLGKQRDLYKFIHDQTLRLANMGYTKEEIAEQVELPDALGKEFYNRGYYGSVHHNVRAVYVKYLGYFDGNPCTLHPLPPSASGARYVAFMGGADAVVEKAHASFEEGDYRWVAEVLNHVMMSNPQHEAARTLLADALEQMGYQAESAPWRNFYLTGALELRQGTPRGSRYAASEGIARGMPLEHLFQVLAVRLNPDRADGLNISIDIVLTEPDETWRLDVCNSVLHAHRNTPSGNGATTLHADALSFKRMMLGLADAEALFNQGALTIEGDATALSTLTGLFDTFERRFPIVEPRTESSSGDLP